MLAFEYGLTAWEISLFLEVKTDLSATIRVELRLFHGENPPVQNFCDSAFGY
jgi:hypothetical protein